MKKIALPVSGTKINPHFGHCNSFIFFKVKNHKVVAEEWAKAPMPIHKPGLVPGWLAENKVTDVIVGGIGQSAIQILSQYKINVFVGVPIKNPEELVRDYLEGILETNGNLCDH